MLNSDVIETIDASPDTVIRLLNGHRYVVREGMAELQERILSFRRNAGYACIVSNTIDEVEE